MEKFKNGNLKNKKWKNLNGKFMENLLSILICQICYKTNSNVLLNYFLMGNLGLVLFHQRVNFWCYAGGGHS